MASATVQAARAAIGDLRKLGDEHRDQLVASVRALAGPPRTSADLLADTRAVLDGVS